MHRRKPRLSPLQRTVVLLEGRINSRPFRNRQLEPIKFDPKTAEISFRYARGLVTAVKAGKFREIRRHFQATFPRAEEHGLIIAVIVADKDYNQVLQIRDADPDSSARV